MKKVQLLGASLALLSSIVMLIAPAAAAASPPHSNANTSGSTASVTGNDISWPQCGKQLPGGQLFGIVGVNAGLANTFNACFVSELAWARSSLGGTTQDKAALYVNTANPGNLGVADWPTNGTSLRYGTCTGADDQACAYQYGWQRAVADTQHINGNNPASFKWWLDIETDNSWETATANNVADLEGMADYFQNIGGRVGLYSSAYQWGQIAGSVSPTSSLYGLDSWLPGAGNLTAAKANCSLPGLTNGKTTVAQYVAKRTDYDYSCS